MWIMLRHNAWIPCQDSAILSPSRNPLPHTLTNPCQNGGGDCLGKEEWHEKRVLFTNKFVQEEKTS